MDILTVVMVMTALTTALLFAWGLVILRTLTRMERRQEKLEELSRAMALIMSANIEIVSGGVDLLNFEGDKH